MDISLVCVEDAINNIGFRKLAAFVTKRLGYDAKIFFATQDENIRFSYKNIILGKWGKSAERTSDQIRRMAEPVSDADVVALSSMTPYAKQTKELIEHIRSVNSDAYVVWGGLHPITDPEDAIQHADAICTGEGEFAFAEFLEKYKNGRDYTEVKNFWFNLDGEVIRNSHRPLMSESEMDNLPLPQLGGTEKIFRDDKGYVPLTPNIYRQYNGLGYHAIWSLGCPLHCTFCANTKFIDNHSDYTQVRHPSPAYLVDEIENALDVYPFISSVIIQDDSLMGLHPDTLRALGEEWKSRLDIPFTVMGVIPNYVTEERMEILLDAGMNRLRMGIQNGSKEMLDFYERPAPPGRVKEAARIIDQYTSYMVDPVYDIIVDNPVETTETVRENIELLRTLPRSYNLNLFSLKTIPGTKLEQQLEERNLSVCSVRDDTYPNQAPTLANCLIYLVATFPLPDWLYEKLLQKAEPAKVDQPFYPVLLIVTRFLHYLKRGLDNIRHFEFSYTGSSFGYLLWKMGVLNTFRKTIKPCFSPSKNRPPCDEEQVTP